MPNWCGPKQQNEALNHQLASNEAVDVGITWFVGILQNIRPVTAGMKIKASSKTPLIHQQAVVERGQVPVLLLIYSKEFTFMP